MAPLSRPISGVFDKIFLCIHKSSDLEKVKGLEICSILMHISKSSFGMLSIHQIDACIRLMHESKSTYIDQTPEQMSEITSRDFLSSWLRSSALNNCIIANWLEERTEVISDVAFLLRFFSLWQVFLASLIL